MQKMLYTVKGEGSYGYAMFTIRELYQSSLWTTQSQE